MALDRQRTAAGRGLPGRGFFPGLAHRVRQLRWRRRRWLRRRWLRGRWPRRRWLRGRWPRRRWLRGRWLRGRWLRGRWLRGRCRCRRWLRRRWRDALGLALLQLLEAARPVLLEEARQAAIGEQPALGLTGRTVVRLVVGVHDALHPGAAHRARLAVLAVH